MGCPGAGEPVVWFHTVPLAIHVSAQINPWLMRPTGPAGLQSAVSEALSATSLNLKVASRNHCRLCFKNSSKFVTERMETPLDTNCEASPLSL